MNPQTPPNKLNRLLVADGNFEARRWVADIGRELGFTVVEAGTAAQLHDEFARFSPTVVVLDPHGLGTDEIDFLSGLERRHGKAAIIITSYAQEDLLASAEELALSFGLPVSVALRKPLTRDSLEAALTPQFMIIAAAMVLTQACVTTVQSAGVSHLAKLGDTAEFAALMLSLQSMLATLAKGASGTLSEVIPPKQLLVIGLVIECLGMVLLAHAQSHALSYAFALAFGIGWGAAYLSVTVLLINYFGPNTGSAALSTVWLLAGVAAIGPIAAGMVADRFGSFSPVFTIGGLLLLPVALGLLIMRAPSRRAAEALPLVAAAGRSR